MKKLLALIIVLSLVFTSSSYSGEFFPAKVKDISDRNYEPSVIKLLDNAKESIVISMYIIKPSDAGPISLLVNDLAEALGRGVTVDIFINTRFSVKNNGLESRKRLKDLLVDKGANIYEVDSNRRLHDKVIIVDSRFIVEGSTNWSVSALKNNFESSSLIDSPPLAKIKLARIKNLPLEIAENKKIAKWIGNVQVPSIELKTALIEEEGYFPHMVEVRASRAMIAYLLLLRESLSWDTVDPEGEALSIPVSLETLAKDMEVDGIDRESRRRALSKVLEGLDSTYGLIDVEFRYNKDALVIVKDVPGATIPVDISFFEPSHLNSISTNGKFVLLVKDLLDQEGKTMNDYKRNALAKRFHIERGTLRKGINEVGE